MEFLVNGKAIRTVTTEKKLTIFNDPKEWCNWRNHWPRHLPMPTDEEYEAAKQKYQADCAEWMAKGDMSDFNMGFEFAITTYNPITWMRFFGYDVEYFNIEGKKVTVTKDGEHK